MKRYIEGKDFEFAKYCQQQLAKNPGDVWVDPIVPQRFASMPLAMTAWQYSYLKIDDYIEKAIAEAKKHNRKVRLYIQDTSDVWNHPDLAPYYNKDLSRNYTTSPSGEVHGHSHMVGGQFIGGDAASTKIGLIRRFVEEGLVEIVLQKVLSDTGSGSFSWITNAHQDVINDEFDGAKFINMSYGGPSSYAPLSQVMATGKSQGIFYFASIGNSGYKEGEDRSGFPGNDPSTIGCASIDSSGNRSYFSAVDSSRIAMFMAAPGSAVPTTLKDGAYGSVNGTSFSGPNSCAMGIIEYLLNPSITNQDELEAKFIQDLTDHGLEGRDKFLGYGVPVMTDSFFSGDNPPPPPIPVPIPPILAFPINNEVLKEEEVTFIWQAAVYAISYTIQVVDSTGKEVFNRTTTGTTYSYKLEEGDYSWRVRSLGINGNSEYSSFAQFSIKQEESKLEAPVPISPADGSITEDIEIKFEWTKVDNAASYYLEVKEEDGSIAYNEIVYSTSIKITLDEGEYAWRAKSISSDNRMSEFSSPFSFTVKEKKELEWPRKDTIVSLDTIFETGYKLKSSSTINKIKFKVDISHNHSSEIQSLYQIIRDRLASYYSRSYISFSSDKIDHHVALYYIARFTKIVLKDIEVERIEVEGEVGVLLEKEDLKKVPAQDTEATIGYLW